MAQTYRKYTYVISNQSTTALQYSDSGRDSRRNRLFLVVVNVLFPNGRKLFFVYSLSVQNYSLFDETLMRC